MDPRRARYLVTGVVLVAIGAASLYVANPTVHRESTFLIPPGYHYRIPAGLASGTAIEGSFREMSGLPVNFYIMSSAQYNVFLGGTWAGSLYGVRDAISSTVAYTTTSADTYYLVFTHGTGQNGTQTVSFDRTFRSVNLVWAGIGIGFLAIAAADFYLALRRSATGPPPGVGPPRPPDSGAK